ncbi:LuxR C-terminal-related transcriptional regulator [Streptomyces sp. NPDC001941]|uniref:helix-turn-helix transcriptional regulator n=1 Tax=Streptomyces sp. NPDC001941 TaxID=3154659 RepID=UPI0033307434
MAKIWLATLLVGVRDLSGAARALAELDATAPPVGESPAGKDTADESPVGKPVAVEAVATASLLCAAHLSLARGEHGNVVALVHEASERARRAGLGRLLPDAHTVMALSALRQGDMSVGMEFTNQLRDCALLGQTAHRPSQCAWVAAQLLEVQGGADSAAHLVVGLTTDDELLRELLAFQPAAAAWLVRATRRLGDEGLARHVASAAEGLAAGSPGLRSPEAAAAHARGLFDRDADRVARAARLHLDLWAAASAREDAGRLLSARPSERDRAVDLLEAATGGYTASAAPRDARRVASRLRALGVRRGARRPYGAGDAATGALTDTEAAVAELVSHGFTNSQVGERLFISGHTVAFHLKKIFRKMDVGSRVELTRAWSRLSDR